MCGGQRGLLFLRRAGEPFSQQQGVLLREAEKPPRKSITSCSGLFVLFPPSPTLLSSPWSGVPGAGGALHFRTLGSLGLSCAFDVAAQFSREGMNVSPTRRLTHPGHAVDVEANEGMTGPREAGGGPTRNVGAALPGPGRGCTAGLSLPPRGQGGGLGAGS